MKQRYTRTLLLISLLSTAMQASAQLHTWIELGGGIHSHTAYPYVESIYADTNGNIYAGGYFTDTNGYSYVAKWDGSSWSELGTGANALKANSYIQAVTGDASGNIYAAGNFTDATGTQYVAKWNGTAWSELGTINNSVKFQINCLLTDPAGNVYAAGALTDDSFHVCVSKWNGSIWSPVGTGIHALGVNANINTLCMDPSGNLYAAGAFTDSGSFAGHAYVAKWDGTNWSPLGTGANALLPNSYFATICSDPSGNIYAAGTFTDMGTTVLANQDGARYVAKWDGSHWTRLGGTTDTFICTPNSLDNIHSVMSDAAGNIYAAGGIRDTTEPTVPNRYYVAKWDGVHWSEVGTASNHQLSHGYILTTCMDHLGNIYAAGDYISTGGTFTNVAEYVIQPLGIVGVDQQRYDLYPNPSSGIVTLHLSETHDATLSLYDMSGQILQTWQCTNEATKQLDISSYAAGLYLLRVETVNAETSVMKVQRQ